MDHNEAIRLQAAEKYVMGELSPALRDEYEDHYFDCCECAADLQATIAFVETSREVLCDEPQKSFAQPPPDQRRVWLAWLKPSVAAPVFVVMVLALIYQTFVSVPYWKAQSVQSASPRVLPMYSLIAANSRGAETLVIQAHRGERIGFYVDIPADNGYAAYILRLEDPRGHTSTLNSLTLAEAKRTQVVEVDPGNAPGPYQLVVLGLAKEDSDLASAVTLSKMRFAIALNP
jgi:hypothetical protein